MRIKKSCALLSLVVVALCLEESLAFATAKSFSLTRLRTTTNALSWRPLYESPQSVKEEENESVRRNKSKNRGGGRARKRATTKSKPKKEPQNWFGLLAPLLLLAILSNLFSGLTSERTNSSFYYYQSSMYENQVYRGDGTVDRSRKESVRTNVPSLLQDRKNSDTTQSLRIESRDAPDVSFEQDLNDEIGSMMRFQRSIVDDFF